MTNKDVLQHIDNSPSLMSKILKLESYYFRYIVRKLMICMEKVIQFGLVEGARWHGKLKMQWIDMIRNAMGLSLCKLMKNVQE